MVTAVISVVVQVTAVALVQSLVQSASKSKIKKKTKKKTIGLGDEEAARWPAGGVVLKFCEINVGSRRMPQ